MKRLALVSTVLTILMAQMAFGQKVVLVRDILTEHRSLYVRTDGNDDNDGSANNAAHAFRTIQAAVNSMLTLDTNGFIVTIQIGDGTYNEAVSFNGMKVGAGSVYLQGNSTNTSAVVIDGGSGIAAINVEAGSYTPVHIQYLKLQSTGVSGGRNGILATQMSLVYLNQVNFGLCGGAHIASFTSGRIVIEGNGYTISGNATYHLLTLQYAAIEHSGGNVTITGNPAFSTAFASAQGIGQIIFWGIPTWSGTATGNRYWIIQNSIINTFGRSSTWLPGNLSGTIGSGGQYL
jgi:hypothetical protein